MYDKMLNRLNGFLTMSQQNTIPFVAVIQSKLNMLLIRCSPSVVLWQKLVNDVIINYYFSDSWHLIFTCNKWIILPSDMFSPLVHTFLQARKHGSGGDEHEGFTWEISCMISHATYFLLHIAHSCNNMTHVLTHSGQDKAGINVSRT